MASLEQVMTRPLYNDARRVFWIVDNCSAHRGARAECKCTRQNLDEILVKLSSPHHSPKNTLVNF